MRNSTLAPGGGDMLYKEIWLDALEPATRASAVLVMLML